MKKNIILVLILVIFTLTSTARPLKRGYRGFVDWNGEVSWANPKFKVGFLNGISTSHGYQFNKRLYVGGGLWIQGFTYSVDDPGLGMHWFVLPVFVQARSDFNIGNLPLFADLRVGVHPAFGFRLGEDGADKFFLTPSVGMRKAISDRISWNIGLGASFHTLTGGDRDGSVIMPSVRVGFDF